MRWTSSTATIGTRWQPHVGQAPADPGSRSWNASIAVECALTAWAAGMVRPPMTTTTPAPAISPFVACRTASARLREPSKSGDEGRAHRAGDRDRLVGAEQQVVRERGLLDRVGALDDDGAVDLRSVPAGRRPGAQSRAAAQSAGATPEPGPSRSARYRPAEPPQVRGPGSPPRRARAGCRPPEGRAASRSCRL